VPGAGLETEIFEKPLTNLRSLEILNRMVNYSPASLDQAFGALADRTRRAILSRLAKGEATVTELAEPFQVSLPAVSKHLRVLESAGLLKREIDGRVHRCRLAAEPMKRAAEWIDTYRAFWESQFDELAKYLESTKEEKDSWPARRKIEDSRSKSAGRSRRRAKKLLPPGSGAKK
jgi:DNA-binding transcriptional ArsR family regulator